MTYYKKDESMVTRKIADEVILVPVKQNVVDMRCMYTLNEVGSRIWELINGGTSVKAIASVLAQEYKVEAGQVEGDILDFLRQLEEIGAVTLMASINQKGG